MIISPGRVSTVSLTIEKKDGTTEETTDFEKAMEICGNGRYQYLLLLVCGIMFSCIGMQYGINAYILPSAECDLNMRSEEKGFLNVAFFLGSVFSALFWGVIAGAYGRRNIIVMTMFADCIVTVIASLAPGYKLFLMLRIISGFLMGAPGSLIYTYLGEFHAEKHRQKCICFLGFFFPFAWLLLPGLAWLIIPLPVSFEFYGIRCNSWRIYLGAISLPTFIIAMIALMYPESPKFLVSQGKTDEALKVLQNIYMVNTKRDKSEFPVKQLLSEAVFEAKDNLAPSSPMNVIVELSKNIGWQLRTIASPPLSKYALLLWTIYASNMFGYYGFGLWMPDLFNRFEKYHHSHPNASVTVCELIHEMHDSSNATVIPEDPFSLLGEEDVGACKPHIDERVFVNSLTTNGVCLMGSIISGFLSTRVGRRTMPTILMVVAGIAGFTLYFMRSSVQILVVSCVFSLTITTANFVITGVAVNVFPTHVTAAAVSMMICLGRIAVIVSNLSFGLLLDLSCEVPIFLLGGVAMFGGLLAFLIPNKEKR